MRILVWCHTASRGGMRLLSRFLPALAAQPNIERIRVAAAASLFQESHLSATEPNRLERWEITPHPRGRFQNWLARDQRVLGIKGSARLKRWLRGRLNGEGFTRDPLAWYREQFERAARDCDMVYDFWPHGHDLPLTSRPVVCTYHDATIFDFPELLAERTLAEWRRAREWLYGSARVVVSSQATRHALCRHFGLEPEAMCVIRHDILPDRPEASERPSRYGQALPPQYLILPSNIWPHKNHYNLFVAWSRFARRKEFPLVLLGDLTDELNRQGPDWSEYSQGARLAGLIRRLELRLGEDIYVLGTVEDAEVMPLIRRATALVMPTLSEGGGSFPIEEALSVGVPVLCSDIPVLREQLVNRSARIGWFDPLLPESILSALHNLCDHYAVYKESAVAASRDPRPTWNDVAAQYVEVFRGVLDG